MDETSRFLRYRPRLIWAALAAAVLVAYGPAIHGGFIWDDDGHVTKPALRSLHGLWRIWFDLRATQQYYPVLHSAFWVEHRLWGDATVGYHLTNILLHATSAFLFGVILRRLKIPGAWLAAFIFALHPVCVESVAWISEQKNTLSTVFYLLAALTYLRWRESEKPGLYALAALLFVLALLSKSVTATLPAGLLVVLWWQQGRLSWKRDIAPLAPWLAMGLAAGLFTAWVERHYGGAQGAAYNLSLLARGLLAGRVIAFYLGKLFWPANLIFIYPHWRMNAGEIQAYLYLPGMVGLIAALWLIRKRTRGPLAGVLFFVGSLVPALGFFNVYPFIYSYVADHFQYLASLGIIALAAAGIGRFRLSPGKPAAAALIAILGLLTWRQARQYRNVETLYQTTLERNPQCWMAHTNLGIALAVSGRLNEAIGHYEQALEIDPSLAMVHNDLGSAFVNQGRLAEAVVQFQEAVRLQPDYAEAHYNLGVALQTAGRTPGVVAELDRAVRLKPNFPEAHLYFGGVLRDNGDIGGAIREMEAALRFKPDYPEAHYDLGVILQQAGQIPDSIAHFKQALQFAPDFPEANFALGTLLAGQGRPAEAIAYLEKAVRLRPATAGGHYNLAVVLRQLGRENEAAAQFAEAARLGTPGR